MHFAQPRYDEQHYCTKVDLVLQLRLHLNIYTYIRKYHTGALVKTYQLKIHTHVQIHVHAIELPKHHTGGLRWAEVVSLLHVA